MGNIELEEEVVLEDIDLDVVYLGEMTTDHSKLENLSYEASNHTGFQKEIDNNNRLASDLVDDTDSENKFVTSEDISNWNTKVDKNVDDLTYYYTKTEVDGKISSVYKYKGTVATYEDLPDTGLSIGDVYNVESDGNNYAWAGTVWDKLGGDIDISNLQTKITSTNKLSSDLVDDTNGVNKFVTNAEKNIWNNKSDFSGDYDDLSNKPTDISDFENDIGYLSFQGKYVVASSAFDFRGKDVGLYFTSNYMNNGQFRYIDPANPTTPLQTSSAELLFITKDLNAILAEGVTEDTYFAYSYGWNNQGCLEIGSFYIRPNSNHIERTGTFNNSVKSIGNFTQSFDGEKYFSGKLRSPVTPTADDNIANKKYVDDSIASAITDALGGSY